MNRIQIVISVSGLILWTCVSNASANLVTNGGFEDGLNGWTWFGNGTTQTATLSTDTPTSVGNSADLDINEIVGLPWLTQDVSVNAGDNLTFSTWVREVEAATPTDAWIAAQVWMLPDSGSASILSSAALFFSDSNWSSQSTEITVPAGATIARILFTPQNPGFGVGNGQYRIDDVSLTIPEPASAVLLLTLGALALLPSRFRRGATHSKHV